MKKLITIIIIFSTALNMNAQDIILTRDGRKIEAKVEEVGIEVVKYKRFANQTGPAYLIKKSEVSSILYENGDFDVFKDEQKSQDLKQKLHVIQRSKKLTGTGTGLIISGLIVTAGGVGLYLGSYEVYYKYTAFQMWQSGVALLTIGCVTATTGITFAIIGTMTKNNIANISLHQTDKYRLDVAIYGNSMGLRLKF